MLDKSANHSQTLSHHQLHQQLRRLISVHEQDLQKDLVSDTKEHTLMSSDTAVTTDETKAPPKEDLTSKTKEADQESNEEVKFVLGNSRFNSVSSEIDSCYSDYDEALSSQPEETEAQRVLPWKRTTQLPPVSSSMSMSMQDDDHPLMSTVPSWANNLAYNHLTETGSPYVSPDNTIGAPIPVTSYRPVFDIFPPSPDQEPSTPEKEKAELLHSPIPPPWSSFQTSLPAPWVSSSTEDPPLTSPEAHKESCGEKVSTYLQSSLHNFFPPSHHTCLATQDEVTTLPCAASVRGLRPTSSPQHFQPIQIEELCSRQSIETEIIADEADYQERLVTRVQSWLDSSEPSDCDEKDFEELTSVHTDDHTVHFDAHDDIDIDDSHLDTYL